MNKILTTVFLLFLSNSFAQNTSTVVDPMTEKLQNFPKNQTADLVYLQTSKNSYETEEDLWFKGYVLDAQYFYPSERSKTLYVQLISDTNKVVWEKKYEIEYGFVNGHLFLDSSLEEGNYTLTAYSSGSFELCSKEFYAAKKIKIQKTIQTKPVIIPVEKDSTILFTTFPEGGKLVSGIESTLAFKAVNSKGFPVIISGTLFENDIPLLPFSTSHAGMGGFDFTPDSNKKYHIQLRDSEKKYDIAAVASSGKVLHWIGSNKELVYFKVTQTDDLKEEKVYVRLQVRGVVYRIAIGLLRKELVLKIPLNDIPQGIAEVTLFNESGLPLAERLVYINQDQKLTIKSELNKTAFTTRDKASLKIKVTDENGEPIVAHLGLSVYDGIYQNKQEPKSIQTHYLLSTQLKGNIYNPAYYFNEENKDRKQALNLLMLTQGWRNYVWNEDNVKELVVSDSVVLDELKGNIRLAKIKKKVNEPIGKKTLTVETANEKISKHFISTDTTGVFSISSKELKKGEGAYVYLTLLNDASSKHKISFTNNFFEGINTYRNNKILLYPISALPEIIPDMPSPFIDRPSINKLKEVKITTRNKKAFRDKYIGRLDSLARLDRKTDYYCINNILNCKNHPEPRYDFRALSEAELLEKFNVIMIEGYYGKKVFYEAVYDEVTITDSTPDFRNTLFWKSDIITNEHGEANVDFFCSDINSLFLGNIEGVSGNGLLGAENFKFKVKKKED